MKRIITICVMCFVMLGLVACNSNNTSNNSSNATSNATQNDSKTAKTVSYVTEDGKFEITELSYYESPNSGEVCVGLRVKNLTEEDVDYIELWGYGYDTNGDKCGDCKASIWDIEAGHTAETNGQMPFEATPENFGGVKFKSYTVREEKDGKLYELFSLDFDNKMDIPKDDMNETDWQGNLK